MPGIGKAELDVVIDLNLLAVFAHHQVAEGALHIGQRVQGLHRGTSGPLALLVFPFGVTFLDVGGIPQHNVQQLGGEAGAVDVAAKSLLDEQGNAAGVVNVGVGDNDILNVAGHEVQLGVVDLIPPLLQAAVNEHLVSVALHTVAAAGDGFGCTEKCELHPEHLLCNIAKYIVLYMWRIVKKHVRGSGGGRLFIDPVLPCVLFNLERQSVNVSLCIFFSSVPNEGLPKAICTFFGHWGIPNMKMSSSRR